MTYDPMTSLRAIGRNNGTDISNTSKVEMILVTCKGSSHSKNDFMNCDRISWQFLVANFDTDVIRKSMTYCRF